MKFYVLEAGTDERARRAPRPWGFDAIHLASALEVEQPTGSTGSFLCFDDRLREAASAEGLSV